MIIIEIAGHLGADPETRITANGHKVTSLRVAVNVREGDKDETLWWQVSIWGSEFDNMIKHLKKGSAVIVIGEMGKLSLYTDKEGRQQISYRMNARMLKFSPFGKPDRQSQENNTQHHQGSYAAPSGHSNYNAQHSPQHGFDAGAAEQMASTAYGAAGHYATAAQDHEEPPF